MQPDVPVSLEEVATLADLSQFHARQRPDKEALLFEGRSTSYAELDRQASQVANGLLGLDLTLTSSATPSTSTSAGLVSTPPQCSQPTGIPEAGFIVAGD